MLSCVVNFSYKIPKPRWSLEYYIDENHPENRNRDDHINDS